MKRSVVLYTRGETFSGELPAGLEPVAVVEDNSQGKRLGDALSHLATGAASALVLARLRAVARSLRELVRLLDWLERSGCDLVALDLGLDTATGSGRRTVALLREIERWGREPDHPRRPPGRPGLSAISPALVERIAGMRASGLSLQAIADALNSDRVPTPRGGQRWRPSSVQAALGYRRPEPPAPGAPPPPPPRPGQGKHSRPRGPRDGPRA